MENVIQCLTAYYREALDFKQLKRLITITAQYDQPALAFIGTENAMTDEAEHVLKVNDVPFDRDNPDVDAAGELYDAITEALNQALKDQGLMVTQHEGYCGDFFATPLSFD